MVLENYTSEVFIENFLKDRHELGEDAQYIYEEIFSAILGKEVHLDNFVKEIDEALEEDTINVMEEVNELGILSEEESEELEGMLMEGLFGDIKDRFNKIFNPNGLEFNLFGGITKDSMDRLRKNKMKELEKLANGSGGFFSRIKNKVKTFFGGLKGKSFGEIMKEGLAWFTNPENMSKALGTAGGVVLLGLILRTLKKRKKMKEYEKLHRMADEASTMNEDEYSIANAKEKVMLECSKNKKLNKALIEYSGFIEDDYFGY